MVRDLRFHTVYIDSCVFLEKNLAREGLHRRTREMWTKDHIVFNKRSNVFEAAKVVAMVAGLVVEFEFG